MPKYTEQITVKFGELKSSMWLTQAQVRIVNDGNRNAEPEQDLAYVLTFEEAVEAYKNFKKEHYAVSIFPCEEGGDVADGWKLTTLPSYTPKQVLNEATQVTIKALVEGGISEAEAVELTRLG
ncbi:hypothetical protein ACMZOO_02910 [Catenovulum sp. SX2]|uniref:hypothetical protein n=1 Tax=Catenovulum sp. SX2 TaxID=3398614 RepID=UPI003F87FA96